MNCARKAVAPKRQIKSIKMKRKHIALKGDDKYGHWWLEIGDPLDPNSESYGWWPASGVGLGDTLFGTAGDLNGQAGFGGTAVRDPHHGDPADEEFHPIVPAGDTRSDQEIENCLRDFAGSYSGEWRWTFGFGQNCHTFQDAAMEHCGLEAP